MSLPELSELLRALMDSSYAKVIFRVASEDDVSSSSSDESASMAI